MQPTRWPGNPQRTLIGRSASGRRRRWEVTRTNYDFDREIYAWRHQQAGGKPPTLRIARYVLEHYPAFVVLYHLDQLKVAQAMRARPAARLVVVENGEKVSLVELSGTT
jgi:hypothetical protein